MLESTPCRRTRSNWPTCASLCPRPTNQEVVLLPKLSKRLGTCVGAYYCMRPDCFKPRRSFAPQLNPQMARVGAMSVTCLGSVLNVCVEYWLGFRCPTTTLSPAFRTATIVSCGATVNQHDCRLMRFQQKLGLATGTTSHLLDGHWEDRVSLIVYVLAYQIDSACSISRVWRWGFVGFPPNQV